MGDIQPANGSDLVTEETWLGAGDVLEFGCSTLSRAHRSLARRGVAVELGERAFDLLLCLVESRGSILSKDQLMAKVWPGRIVEENTLEGQMSLLRRALGEDRTAIRTIAGRGYQFIGHIRQVTQQANAPAPAVATPSPSPAPSNLPASISQLIGRETALAEIAELSLSNRLITLVGTGGVGKTRLAVEAARANAERFRDGVCFAELASIASSDFLLVTLAQALGYSPGDGFNSQERICGALQSKQLLLVLDNCEHLVDAIALLVERLLRAAPAVSVIATSREALRADGEYVYRVASLDVPISEKADREELSRSGAVRLFEARLGSVSSDSTSPKTAQLMVRICRRLDGIPLALELAAARVEVLGLQGVSDRLDNRFQLLTNGARTALPRQQTLRATLDWSYDLLAPAERIVLAKLSVFAGSFCVDAAQYVAASDDSEKEEVFERIANLVTKSLMVPDHTGPVSRFRMLETTRVYCREKLTDLGTRSAISHRHATFFLTLFEQCAEASVSGMSADRRAYFAAHLEDYRLAVSWAFGEGGNTDIGVNLTIAWLPVALQLGLLEECLTRVDTALASLSPADADTDLKRMKLYAARGAALLFRTGGEATGIAFRLALDIADRVGDTEYQKRGIWGSWCYAYLNGHYAEALRLAERFYALATQLSNHWDELTGQRILGITHLCLGNLEESKSSLEAMLAGHPHDASREHRVRFLYDEKMLANASLAQTLWLLGMPDRAMAVALRSRQDALELDHAPSLCFALSEAVCVIALLNGERSVLLKATTELTEATRRHGVSTWKARARMWAALPKLEQGEVDVYQAVIAPALAEIGDAQFFISLTPFICAVGISLGEHGLVGEGLKLIGPAIARASINRDATSLVELLRVNALLLLMRGGAEAETRVEEQLEAALNSAGEQGFVAWELRCMLSLCALWQAQGRLTSTNPRLISIYEKFNEGYETLDLMQAKGFISDRA